MDSFYDIPDIESRVIWKGDYFFIIEDGFPVSPGHLLIVSRVVHRTWFDLPLYIQKKLPDALETAKAIVSAKGLEPDGWNIGMNCGKASGQTINHFHCHVIPRYENDMENPTGGVRHCIPGKGNYKTYSLKEV